MFDALFVPDAVRAELADMAWVQAMLDAERALARAEAELGLIPLAAAAEIAGACTAGLYDAAELAVEARAVGNPAEPLVRALRAHVGGEFAGFVHHGATSQDIVDTAAMLVADRVLALVLADVDAIAAACAGLAQRHRDTPMVARTLLQQALPTTFGLKAAGWLAGVLEAGELVRAARGRLAVQFGGAAGTLALLGDRGAEVLAAMAADLGLAEPLLPWHTSRVRLAALAGALVALSGALAKIALDVVLLAQTEVSEVAEPRGRGGSSTLPHKRNPIGSTLTIASARRVSALAVLIGGGAPHEHERATGAWHAEWEGLEGVLAGAAGAAWSLRGVLEGLEVDAARMRENLAATRGLIMAERVRALLGTRLDAADAAGVVAGAAERTGAGTRTFADELRADPRMPLTAVELDSALDPLTYLGSAGVFVDRALDLWDRTNPRLEGQVRAPRTVS